MITAAWEKVFNMKASDINPIDGMPNFVVLQDFWYPPSSTPLCCCQAREEQGGKDNE